MLVSISRNIAMLIFVRLSTDKEKGAALVFFRASLEVISFTYRLYHINRIAIVTNKTTTETGKAHRKKSSKESPPRNAKRTPTGLPSNVAVEPTFVVKTENMTRGAAFTFKDLHISNIIAVISRIDATSPMSADRTAEIMPKRTKRAIPLMHFILNMADIKRWKMPVSLIAPITIMIPIKKSITSREANFMKFSKSTLRVRNKTPLPRKTRLTLRSQKNKVPKMEDENMNRTNDCLRAKPFLKQIIASRPDITDKIIILRYEVFAFIGLFL